MEHLRQQSELHTADMQSPAPAQGAKRKEEKKTATAKYRCNSMVKTHSLTNAAFNNLRAIVITAFDQDSGRYGIRVLMANNTTKDILVKPENLKLMKREQHFGRWSCSGCGVQCSCSAVPDTPHDNSCDHFMNTLRRKGPDCPQIALPSFWFGCCLSTERDGPCLALDRNNINIPVLPHPEKEWVSVGDGKQLQPKKWPYGFM